MRSVNTALLLSAAILAPLLSANSRAEEIIKIAFIEGLSGPFANVGEIGLRHYQLAAETVNARGGVLDGAAFHQAGYDFGIAVVAIRVPDQRRDQQIGRAHV